MEREITVREFVTDLLRRLETTQTIDCCKQELRTFAELAVKKMPDEKIKVDWKD